MRNKLKVLVTMCALVLGLSATAAAQTRYGRRNSRTVTVYQNNRRVYRRPIGGNVIILPNNRPIFRGSRDDGWGNRQVNRARTYRLPNGRLVTVLPNGRRIYH
jgi:hypothetical protein